MLKKISNFIKKPQREMVQAASILGILVAVGMVLAIVVQSNTKLILAREDITVKGVGTKDVEADSGSWKITINTLNDSRIESLKEMERQQIVVEDFLKKNSSFSVKAGIANTQEKINYNQEGSTFAGYTSKISIIVTTSNVQDLFDAASSFNSFAVANDLSVSSSTTDFFYSKLDSLKISLLERAVFDAKKRAEALGSSTGTKIGKVRSASQGIFQVNQRGHSDVSSGGNYSTESIDKTVRGTVEVTFEVY